VDIVTNSRGERIPGVEVHAQFLENIFDRSFLTRPPWLPGIELAILLVSGMMMIRDVPKMKPKLSTFLAIALITVFLASGFILYQTTGLLLDAASLSLGVGACFICLIISSLIITDRKRHAAERALQLEREEAARVVGEMEAAKRIQMGSLPRAETLFSGETRFDLSALLEPALDCPSPSESSRLTAERSLSPVNLGGERYFPSFFPVERLRPNLSKWSCLHEKEH